MSETVEIVHLNADQLQARKWELIELLQDVVDGGASVSFIAPLDTATADKFWSKIQADTAEGERIVLVALIDNRVIGSAQLVLATTPNGIHRAEVQKMLVHSQFRRRGIGKQLLTALDHEARALNRQLLILDTERGSVAEKMYEQYGYHRAGIIPSFAMDSTGTKLVDTVLFYRLLVPQIPQA